PLGDGRDHLDDVADLARRLRQRGNRDIGFLGRGRGLAREFGRSRGLTADLADRHRELVARGGGGGDAGGGFVEAGGHVAGLHRRLLGGRGHRAGGRLELARRGGDTADDVADGAFELVGQAQQRLVLLAAHFLALALEL